MAENGFAVSGSCFRFDSSDVCSSSCVLSLASNRKLLYLYSLLLSQGAKCVVYSFGSNGQLTFEEALIDATHGKCEVHVFDFSLSAEQVQQVKDIKGVTFHDYGIGAVDQHIADPFIYEGRTITSYELKSLPTIMKDLGHTWVDVLKMDVEGAEYSVLRAVVQHYKDANQAIPITQAQIEYHHGEVPTRQELIATLTVLEQNGFRAFHSEYNYHGEPWHYIEYAYLHVDESGKVVTPFTSNLGVN